MNNKDTQLKKTGLLKEIEEKVIELYEAVAVMALTPKEAREEFMKIIDEIMRQGKPLTGMIEDDIFEKG